MPVRQIEHSHQFVIVVVQCIIRRPMEKKKKEEMRERRNGKGKKTLISFTVQKNARSKANSQGSYESEWLRGGETIKRIQLKKK